MAKPSQRTLEISLFLLIALLTAAVYLPALNWFMERETVDSYIYPMTFHLLQHLPAWIFYQATPGFIRPIYVLSLFPDVWLYGASAWAYRLTNLLLHFSCLIALYVFGRVLFGRTLWLLLAVSVFALHPALTGGVVIIFARQESLALFFLLMGLAAWGSYLKDPQKGWRYPWGAGLLFLLSLLSKETALCFPLVVVALHFVLWKQGKTTLRLRDAIRPYFGLALLLAGYLTIRWLCFGGIGGYGGVTKVSTQILKRLAGVVMVPVTPLGYNYLHSKTITFSLVAALGFGSLVLLIGLWPRRTGSPHWATIFGFLFMLLSAATLLTIDWVAMGLWHVYMPMAGFALGIAGLFRETAERFTAWRKPIIGAAILLPLALTPATRWEINHHWRGAGESHDPSLRYVIEHPPEPGRTLQIWNPRADYMAIFEAYPNLASIRHEKYLNDYLDLILYAPTAGGKIVLGYHLWRPYQVSLNPREPIYHLTFSDDTPALAQVDSATFWREVDQNQRMGVVHGSKLKNPDLIKLLQPSRE